VNGRGFNMSEENECKIELPSGVRRIRIDSTKMTPDVVKCMDKWKKQGIIIEEDNGGEVEESDEPVEVKE
jgi:hypothetical protein